MDIPLPTVRYLGIQNYAQTLRDMQQFTANRQDDTADEIWLLEHFPVYTQGQAGKEAHILSRNNIEIIQSDRGGQITYHGPGQIIGYILIDLRRRQWNIRTLVQQIECWIISLLHYLNIEAHTIPAAPGVYVAGQKIASIGLRVKQGCTYHGMALNVAMDLTPFNAINPCGYAGLTMTQLQDYIPNIKTQDVMQLLTHPSIFLPTMCTRE